MPILNDKELLEQTWNLEDQPEENVASNALGVQMANAECENNGKRGREEEEDVAAGPRRSGCGSSAPRSGSTGRC